MIQVTTLVETREGPSKKKKGRSQRAQILVAAVEKATEQFILKGEEIANANPDYRDSLLLRVNEVRETGATMSTASREFASDPCSSLKRANMVKAARMLLGAVARLLFHADDIDVDRLLKSARSVQLDLDQLNELSKTGDPNEFLKALRDLGTKTSELIQEAAKRQIELRDPNLRDDLAAARAVLKKNSMMLLTASKVFVRHPDITAAKDNRDLIFKSVCEAVTTISDVASGNRGLGNISGEGAGELAAAIAAFDHRILNQEPYLDVSKVEAMWPDYEKQLEDIISRAALMADSECTRDERRDKIVSECNAVRQALQDLLKEFMDCASAKTISPNIGKRVDALIDKTDNLSRHLRKAVLDHVSDHYLLDPSMDPLIMLISCASDGSDMNAFEGYAQDFLIHTEKLVEVAKLSTCMSHDPEGIRMVNHAVDQVIHLCPQVINAARILFARPTSPEAMDNMDAFRLLWENQVRLLTDSVDAITCIYEFLAVSENHILENVAKSVQAMQEQEVHQLQQEIAFIQARVGRICKVVSVEMEAKYPPGHTMRDPKQVMAAVRFLQGKIIQDFVAKSNIIVHTLQDPAVDLSPNNFGRIAEENDFIEASRQVYDGVRDVRNRVELDRPQGEVYYDSDLETEDPIYEPLPVNENQVNVAELNARDVYRILPEEEKEKIAVAVEIFRNEKNNFDREVGKWDDTGNDIIVMAKSMCLIMMEMTDFTRGKGPLKTTMHVINAAKKISDLGTKLDKLARQLAEDCPKSETKDDLLAYLGEIVLYCHQLNITSKVKADVQNVSGNLIVSGLDSATSLIQAAKNLMGAVVKTVKCCYVASTKYHSRVPNGAAMSAPLVVWKMKAPEKKPLVRRDKPEETRAKVRRGSQKKTVNPQKVLSEFLSPDY